MLIMPYVDAGQSTDLSIDLILNDVSLVRQYNQLPYNMQYDFLNTSIPYNSSDMFRVVGINIMQIWTTNGSTANFDDGTATLYPGLYANFTTFSNAAGTGSSSMMIWFKLDGNYTIGSSTQFNAYFPYTSASTTIQVVFFNGAQRINGDGSCVPGLQNNYLCTLSQIPLAGTVFDSFGIRMTAPAAGSSTYSFQSVNLTGVASANFSSIFINTTVDDYNFAIQNITWNASATSSYLPPRENITYRSVDRGWVKDIAIYSTGLTAADADDKTYNMSLHESVLRNIDGTDFQGAYGKIDSTATHTISFDVILNQSINLLEETYVYANFTRVLHNSAAALFCSMGAGEDGVRVRTGSSMGNNATDVSLKSGANYTGLIDRISISCYTNPDSTNDLTLMLKGFTITGEPYEPSSTNSLPDVNITIGGYSDIDAEYIPVNITSYDPEGDTIYYALRNNETYRYNKTYGLDFGVAKQWWGLFWNSPSDKYLDYYISSEEYCSIKTHADGNFSQFVFIPGQPLSEGGADYWKLLMYEDCIGLPHFSMRYLDPFDAAVQGAYIEGLYNDGESISFILYDITGKNISFEVVVEDMNITAYNQGAEIFSVPKGDGQIRAEWGYEGGLGGFTIRNGSIASQAVLGQYQYSDSLDDMSHYTIALEDSATGNKTFVGLRYLYVYGGYQVSGFDWSTTVPSFPLNEVGINLYTLFVTDSYHKDLDIYDSYPIRYDWQPFNIVDGTNLDDEGFGDLESDFVNVNGYTGFRLYLSQFLWFIRWPYRLFDYFGMLEVMKGAMILAMLIGGISVYIKHGFEIATYIMTGFSVFVYLMGIVGLFPVILFSMLTGILLYTKSQGGAS